MYISSDICYNIDTFRESLVFSINIMQVLQNISQSDNN